jgi:hypothetical protein
MGANPSPERELAASHKAGAQFPSPLVGEDRLGRSPSEEGAPGIGLPVEAGPPCLSRRGKAHVIRQARPLRLTDLNPRVG